MIKTDDPVTALEAKLDYTFGDRKLLQRALVHSSRRGETDKDEDNETLEFLGDAVLDLVIAKLLKDAYPHWDEGHLSKARADLVNTHALAEIAEQVSLPDALELGRGEEQSGGRQKPSILASSLEAVFGALFEEAGYDRSAEIVTRIFADSIKRVNPETRDSKTHLQEMTQQSEGVTPRYTLTDSTGPPHKRSYEVEVALHGEVLATGKGNSRKSAEQSAAAKALKVLKEREPKRNSQDKTDD